MSVSQKFINMLFVYLPISGSPPIKVKDDQPGLKSEMEQLQGFQKNIAKNVSGKNVSSKDAMKTLKLLPLECRRRGHLCELALPAQNT